MTQQFAATTQPGAPARVAQQPQEDPLLRLLADLAKDRERIRKVADPTAKKALMEVNATAMAYTQEHIGISLHRFQLLQNWAGGVFEDINQRLTALEDDIAIPAALSTDEAQLIVELCAMSKAYAQTSLEQSPELTAEAKAGLERMSELSDLVLNIAADNAEDSGEDEEEEDDEQDDSNGSQEAAGD